MALKKHKMKTFYYQVDSTYLNTVLECSWKNLCDEHESYGYTTKKKKCLRSNMCTYDIHEHHHNRVRRTSNFARRVRQFISPVMKRVSLPA